METTKCQNESQTPTCVENASTPESGASGHPTQTEFIEGNQHCDPVRDLQIRIAQLTGQQACFENKILALYQHLLDTRIHQANFEADLRGMIPEVQSAAAGWAGAPGPLSARFDMMEGNILRQINWNTGFNARCNDFDNTLNTVLRDFSKQREEVVKERQKYKDMLSETVDHEREKMNEGQAKMREDLWNELEKHDHRYTGWSSDHEQTIKRLTAESEATQKDIANLKEMFEELKQGNQEDVASMRSFIQQELNHNLTTWAEKTSTLTESINTLTSAVADIRKDIQALKNNNKDLPKSVAKELEKGLEKRTLKSEGQKAQIEQLENLVTRANDKADQYTLQKEEQRARIDELETTISEMQTEAERDTVRNKEQQARIDELESTISEMRTGAEKSTVRNDQQQAQMDELKSMMAWMRVLVVVGAVFLVIFIVIGGYALYVPRSR